MNAWDDAELLNEFLSECTEGLDRLEHDLVSLEKDPQKKETIGSIFRTIHTIKGTAGFLGLGKLEHTAHAGENLLSKIRDGQRSVTPAVITALLSLLDALRTILKHIAGDKSEGGEDYSQLLETLVQLQKGEDISVQSAAASSAPAERASGGDEDAHGVAIDSSIRVQVGLLDKLMNLVGELVLARNQILQFSTTQEDASLSGTSQRLNLITSELQEGIMKTRMQPIQNIWSKFPRVVRDLAMSCEKEIQLEMIGKETELDRTLIESIKDPLTHLVRNSVDHGIEKPADRVAKGKPRAGKILLRAYHEGGQVNIEISDDGGGLSVEKIKEKALSKSLCTAEQLGRMSNRELMNLIYLPGFSTAEKVTNVSGRGVGMDVVKTNIEKIGGVIDIASEPGKGTTFKIKIPLTLAIIPALIVTSGGDRYAIPQVSLLELVRLSPEQSRKEIENVHGAPVYRLRGNLLPLVYLNRQLGVAPVTQNGATNIVVLQADDRHFGLIVDEVNDTEEIVVKPLGKQLKGIPFFAGATIMGDGKVALILDVLGIAHQSAVVTRGAGHGRSDSSSNGPAADTNRQTLLLFRGGDDTRMAIPLSQVARLEEFPTRTMEHSGDRLVVQYRNQIMPLIRLSTLLGMPESEQALNASGAVQVIVYACGQRSVGLIVSQILDIVEDTVILQKATSRHGVLGSAVIQQRVTDLLDVESLIRDVDPSFFEQDAPVAVGAAA